MRVLILAGPLSARSGVYRSACELVGAANDRGLDWSAYIGMREGAPGASLPMTGITEEVIRQSGVRGAEELRRACLGAAAGSDAVISMTPQSTFALARSRLPGTPRHVAWVRGLPWPLAGEQSPSRRLALWVAARRAFARADLVWATTPRVRREIRSAVRADVVPAGIPLRHRRHDGSQPGPLIFAGRLSAEKNPGLLLEVARRTGLPAVLHGDGPLRAGLQANAPGVITWAGWSDPDDIWAAPGIFLCPSFREAFGRSAVEAASSGMPLVLSDRTGAASALITDPELSARFVLPADDVEAWREAVELLTSEPSIRRELSDHVALNAQQLGTEASLDAVLAALRTSLRKES